MFIPIQNPNPSLEFFQHYTRLGAQLLIESFQAKGVKPRLRTLSAVLLQAGFPGSTSLGFGGCEQEPHLICRVERPSRTWGELLGPHWIYFT